MTARAKVIALHAGPRLVPELSDSELLAACASGDTAALSGLYERHAQPVLRFLSRLAHVSDDEAEDLLQEVFLAAFRAAPRFREQASARSWLFGIAANHARMHARSAARRRLFVRSLGYLFERSSGPDTERVAASRQGISLLEQALAALPHDLRVAFTLCDVEQVPGVEAARALALPEGTLYRRLHEARTRLRAALAGDES